MRNQRLTHRARAMRKDLPEPEMRLWLELRAKRFKGVKFRRQKIIGNYIADFAANEPKLVVEIDGDTHAGSEEYDARRTEVLRREGYCVVRFNNDDVMTSLDNVLEHLARTIDNMLAPPPTPSPEGEGAQSWEPSVTIGKKVSATE